MNRPPLAVLLFGPAIACAACAVNPRTETGPNDQIRATDVDDASSAMAEATAVSLVQASAALRAGDPWAAAQVLFSVPGDQVTEEIVAGVAAAVQGLDREQLDGLMAKAEPGTPDARLGPLLAESALSRAFFGELTEAAALARRARAIGVGGRAAGAVQAVLEQRWADLLPSGAPVFGVVVPVSGSPARSEYARLFLEGIQVAAGLANRAGIEVEVVVEDSRGTAAGSSRGVAAALSQGAVAILGPLDDAGLSAAAEVKPPGVPIFSPTARQLPGGREFVYSLGAPELGAARTLAAAVTELGYRVAIVVHPSGGAEWLEADAFVNAFTELGGSVRRRINYPPGTTTFDGPLTEVRRLVPELLVVAAPARDVELLAPQFSFFGLDTLDIQVAGTDDWTIPPVIEALPQRHTDQVIAVSSTPPGTGPGPKAAFQLAYETHFQKTLLSPVPAAGFDLFRLALAAHGESARTGRELTAVLDGLKRFRGATGTYSVAGGKLVREFYPVRIFEGALLSVDVPLPEIPERPIMLSRPDTLR